mgnify:CR=1 FL=1
MSLRILKKYFKLQKSKGKKRKVKESKGEVKETDCPNGCARIITRRHLLGWQNSIAPGPWDPPMGPQGGVAGAKNQILMKLFDSLYQTLRTLFLYLN